MGDACTLGLNRCKRNTNDSAKYDGSLGIFVECSYDLITCCWRGFRINNHGCDVSRKVDEVVG